MHRPGAVHTDPTAAETQKLLDVESGGLSAWIRDRRERRRLERCSS